LRYILQNDTPAPTPPGEETKFRECGFYHAKSAAKFAGAETLNETGLPFDVSPAQNQLTNHNDGGFV
jgi:hypothetical protein